VTRQIKSSDSVQ